MAQFITTVEVDLIESKFKKIINFQSGLNIISGENGTFKTKLIQAIATSIANKGNFHPMRQEISDVKLKLINVEEEIKVIFISPKRNSEKRSINAIVENLRNQMQNIHTEMSVFNQFEDNTFKTYPSFGELFYKSFSEKAKSGGGQVDSMNEVLQEFNDVVQQIFIDYKLIASWSKDLGRPDLKLDKGNRGIVPIESISLGEQEVLSLVLNLYDNRNSCDTIFIDEPETHLNWHLEEKLFEYFVDYSKNYNKQLIIITHSRIIFWEKFLKFTQFLFWTKSGSIDISNKPSESLKRILAGEITEIIKLGSFEKLTFFIEDSTHELIIKSLAKEYGVVINCIKCGSCQNVKSLYRYSKNIGEWTNAIFLVDGDNQGNEFSGEGNFIHLDKYCLENYLLDKEILGNLLNKNHAEVSEFILEIIKENKKEILGKIQYLDFLLDKVVSSDLEDKFLSRLDASKMVPKIINKGGFKNMEEFMFTYIREAIAINKLDDVFPEPLISVLKLNKI